MTNTGSKAVQRSYTSTLVASDAALDAESIDIAPDVVIGAGVRITSKSIRIAPGARIDAGVTIEMRDVRIGHKAHIERHSTFRAIGRQGDCLEIGDFAFVGHSQNVLVPEMRLGDYTAIHNSCLISGYAACTLGHNCWVGQGTILNSTERLQIGNNVRIGTGSQLWTHIASGELLEGCLLYGSYPLTIEDNVWIVGGAVISPNLVLRNSSVIMVGAVLTKSTEVRHCYAGVPAKDVTDKLPAYRDISLDEKLEMMREFVEDFHASTKDQHRGQVVVAQSARDTDVQTVIGRNGERIVVLAAEEMPDWGPQVTVFSLATKLYRKRRTTLEEKFIRFHLGHRARFVPL